MSKNFEDRDRMSLEDARKEVERMYRSGGILSIHHILENEDGTYSIMRHINCEFCNYCEEGGSPEAGKVHKARANPYSGSL